MSNDDKWSVEPELREKHLREHPASPASSAGAQDDDFVGPAVAGEDLFEGALDLVRLLWEVDHALHGASRLMVRDLGLTGPQRLVIRALATKPGSTPGQLARMLRLDLGTVIGLGKRLGRAGLVNLARDPQDGRRTSLDLTPLGRQVMARRLGTIEERAEKALKVLTPEETDAARRALSTLAAALRGDPVARSETRNLLRAAGDAAPGVERSSTRRIQ